MTDVEQRQLPPHVTTPLLALVTQRSLDEDYAHVAARRGQGERRPGTPSRVHWATFVVVALFGMMAATVGAQTSRDSEIEELGRAALLEQIAIRRAELRRLQSEINSLRDATRVATNRNNTLSERLAGMRGTVSRLEVVTGFGPVRGPGVRIVVSNVPGTEVNSEIRDEDLATLVDGLWEAGAEAIAINDQRINVLGGIRNSGRAIHVNSRPLTEPYVVQAIGDKGTLQARLLRTSQGQAWFGLVDALGFRYSAQNADELRLPAAPLSPLRDVKEHNAAPLGQDEEVAP